MYKYKPNNLCFPQLLFGMVLTISSKSKRMRPPSLKIL
ncbi:mCG147577 [Mus musculus]|nr:mCG147577 [Mus musculus]